MKDFGFLTIITLGTRSGAATGSVLFSILIGYTTGASGLGQFTTFLGLLGTLGIIARFGQDALILRTVASSIKKNNSIAWLKLGLSKTFIPAVLISIVGSIMLRAEVFGQSFSGAELLLFLSLPIFTALSLAAGYLKGLSNPWLAPLLEIGGISCLAALLLLLIGTIISPTVTTVGIIFFIALTITGLFGVFVIKKKSNKDSPAERLGKSEKKLLKNGSLSFTLIAASGFLTQAGIFLLAAPFLSEIELGFLRGAERLALLVCFPALAVEPVIAPHIAFLAKNGDQRKLQKLLLRSLLLVGALSFPTFMILIIWPELALSTIGSQFIQAAPYLQVFASFQLLAAFSSPLSMFLNMSHKERSSMWVNLASLAFALVSVPILCSYFSYIGFVMSYSAIICIRSISYMSLAAIYWPKTNIKRDACAT